jgi:hypothetical protein
MTEFLSGISVPQLAGFALTIIASYLSARWGTAESRNQFLKKAENDERAAVAELIPLLMKFALDCERRKTTCQPSLPARAMTVSMSLCMASNFLQRSMRVWRGYWEFVGLVVASVLREHGFVLDRSGVRLGQIQYLWWGPRIGDRP